MTAASFVGQQGIVVASNLPPNFQSLLWAAPTVSVEVELAKSPLIGGIQQDVVAWHVPSLAKHGFKQSST